MEPGGGGGKVEVEFFTLASQAGHGSLATRPSCSSAEQGRSRWGTGRTCIACAGPARVPHGRRRGQCAAQRLFARSPLCAGGKGPWGCTPRMLRQHSLQGGACQLCHEYWSIQPTVRSPLSGDAGRQSVKIFMTDSGSEFGVQGHLHRPGVARRDIPVALHQRRPGRPPAPVAPGPPRRSAESGTLPDPPRPRPTDCRRASQGRSKSLPSHTRSSPSPA